MRQFNNIRGFSLIEVAVAIAVLVLVLGGVTAVFVAGAKAARKTQQQAVAYNLIRDILENFSDPEDMPLNNGNYPLVTFTLNNITYTRSLTMSDGPVPLSPPWSLKALNATVNWSDGAIARTISVETLKANY